MDKRPDSSISQPFLPAMHDYKPVLRFSDGESDIGEKLSSHEESRRQRSWKTITTLAVTHGLLALIVASVATRWPLPLFRPERWDNVITEHSPFMTDVGLKFDWRPFSSSLFNQTTIYRKDASPEVDAAWRALGTSVLEMVIPEEEAKKSGIDKNMVKVKEEYGGGYIGNIDGLHHLHCLNLLRKGLKWNYDYYAERQQHEFENDPLVLKYHITHCLDNLRQQLMCNVDITLAPFVWYKKRDGSVGPTPFFNRPKICRNYEQVLKYALDKQWSFYASFDERDKKLEMPGEETFVWPDLP